MNFYFPKKFSFVVNLDDLVFIQIEHVGWFDNEKRLRIAFRSSADFDWCGSEQKISAEFSSIIRALKRLTKNENASK